jgi:hypothetical protein
VPKDNAATLGYSHDMTSGWKIKAFTERPGEAHTEQSFLVAIRDRQGAVEALRVRKDLLDARIEVVGEATAEMLSSYGMRLGEMYALIITESE